MNREKLMELHTELCGEAFGLMESKNQDYASGADPFTNFRGSMHVGVEPEIGILIRMLDKMMRIKSLLANGSLAVQNESARDSLRDLINYTVLLEGMLQERGEVEYVAKDAGKDELIPIGKHSGAALPITKTVGEMMRRLER